MCYRPPQAGKPKKCPQCGKMNPPKATHCVECNTELKVEDKKQ